MKNVYLFIFFLVFVTSYSIKIYCDIDKDNVIDIGEKLKKLTNLDTKMEIDKKKDKNVKTNNKKKKQIKKRIKKQLKSKII